MGEGSTPVPDCPGANFDMAQASLIGYAAVNAGGESSHGFQVPASWRGYPLRFQARGYTTCSVSNLVEHMFQ